MFGSWCGKVEATVSRKKSRMCKSLANKKEVEQ